MGQSFGCVAGLAPTERMHEAPREAVFRLFTLS